tara:strand:+ start:657 stop:1166 length:510 start_codon:yes stop_codon:yes gene_type:complete
MGINYGNNVTQNFPTTIIQVQSANTDVSAYTNGGLVTVISQAITPKAASSRILILFRFNVSVSQDTYGGFNIYRDSTEIGKSGQQYGGGNSSQYFGAFNNRDVDAPWEDEVCTGPYMDHPNTTSAITYRVRMRKDFGTDVRSNRPNNSYDMAYSWNTMATLSLLEVEWN